MKLRGDTTINGRVFRKGNEISWMAIYPFLYYVLYTFLLRQAIIDLTGVRKNEFRHRTAERMYIAGSVLIYGSIYLLP